MIEPLLWFNLMTQSNLILNQILNKFDLKYIVLETDSPYLSPVPYRGKRNESSYLSLICEKVAEVYDISKEEVARVTSQNAIDVFGI